MDFGTLRRKLDVGSYLNLEQMEVSYWFLDLYIFGYFDLWFNPYDTAAADFI